MIALGTRLASALAMYASFAAVELALPAASLATARKVVFPSGAFAESQEHRHVPFERFITPDPEATPDDDKVMLGDADLVRREERNDGGTYPSTYTTHCWMDGGVVSAGGGTGAGSGFEVRLAVGVDVSLLGFRVGDFSSRNGRAISPERQSADGLLPVVNRESVEWPPHN
ncbi:MAG: hypothetical protein ACOH1J_02590 [Microbacteriaceae bacterium]